MSRVFYFKANKGIPEWSNRLELHEYLLENDGKKLYAEMDRETGIRTLPQNNALHKYFELLANELNSAGLDMKKVLKPSIEINWTTENVKKYLWKPLQKALTGKDSTTKLDKVKDIDLVYEHLNRHFSEKYGLHVPFPKKNKEEKPIEYPQSDESNTPTI